ncbi:MAG: D-alanine--D-alanine ligase [Deltaproteobacteria bacterium]|nr:D-alanine--D-alanine ligase [Deltaproteobacteria bacterium]
MTKRELIRVSLNFIERTRSKKLTAGDKQLDARRTLFKTRKVAVLMGGFSEERDISLKSGRAVLRALVGLGYNAVTITVGRDVAFRLKDEGIEAAFIALHGGSGEDGSIQGLLEIMDMPYTGSGVLASAVAMDKAATKVFLNYHGIPTPEFMVLKDGDMNAPRLPMPFIVKPARQGSTIGVSLVDTEGGYNEALKEAYRHDSKVLVERFIQGRELTVGILDGRIFPVIEIVPREAIYDFKAKYVKGMSEFRVPAALEERVEAEVKKAAFDAYNLIGCSGAARVDMVMEDKLNTPHILEVNTVPGMTDLSLFPMAAASAGVGYEALVEEMLLGAGVRKY